MKKSIVLLLIIIIFSASQFYSQGRLFKTLNDTTRYTNIGNIGLTISNFGTYGHGFALWPQQPSCEYPIGSSIEHIFDGGLWIGAKVKSDSTSTVKLGPFVTTGAVDAASVANKGGGFEYTNSVGSTIIERSSLFTSKFYNPSAISHQDFVMNFLDTNTTYYPSPTIIEGHTPLGVEVHQETYGWNYSYANNFIIFNYWIKNISTKYLDSIYIGLWTDAVVRNTNITSPRSGGTFYSYGGDGYSDSMKIAYEFDAGGDIGFTDSYVGIQFLGSSAKYDSVNFVSWQFRNTTDPNLFAPQNDFDRYRKLLGYFGGENRFPYQITPSLLKTASNRSIMISMGPIKVLKPGDSVNVVFAIVCAKKYGTDPASFDTYEQKRNLFISAEWARRAYFGEDRNRNGLLDFGEDLDSDGKITRYILPKPPEDPIVKIVSEKNKATIYWSNRSENSVDPILAKKDFEGYRLYRTNAGFDLTENQNLESALIKMAEFDSINSIGLNTGFNKIKLAQPITFSGDTTKYYYKFEVDNLLNGWTYVFSVTAFDKGEATFNLESLESSPLANSKKIIPGVLPTSDEKVEIGVYPNPYYGSAYWDGNNERLRKIYFFNLPETCEITIYTLAGDVVKRMHHDKNSNGSDLRWYQTYSKDGNQVMSGGEHAWDLITDNDQAIATGLYLFSVKDASNGKIKTGKFLIVK